MSCRGFHFALSEAEVALSRSLVRDQERLDYLVEEIEVPYLENHREYLAESDKAWDAMHRTLADGELSWIGGDYPLNHVILAGELLYTKSDYIMSLKSPEQVRDVAAAWQRITEVEFRQRYFAIDPDAYGCPVDETDFGNTWDWFQNVRRVYGLAATDGRYVLFATDQ